MCAHAAEQADFNEAGGPPDVEDVWRIVQKLLELVRPCLGLTLTQSERDERRELLRRIVITLERAELDEHPGCDGAGAHPAMVVAADGRWFRVGSGPTVDLSRRGALRRLLRELASSCSSSRRRALTVSDLFAAGWPGERARHEDAVQRVYTAIRRLRRIGLEGILLRRDDGYLLSEALTVRLAAGSAPQP